MGLVNVVFIVDANSTIGYGHLNRCGVLADELIKTRRYKVYFSFETTNQQTIGKYGRSYGLISREALLQEKFDSGEKLLIVDSLEEYHYSEIFQELVIELGYKLMHFAVRDEPVYLSHIVLNPNLHALKQHFKTSSYTQVLLGPEFFIFREEFRNAAGRKARDGQEILISFGAADPNDFSFIAAKALKSINAKHLYTIVTGPLYDGDIDTLTLPSNIRHISNPGSMVDLMVSSQMAICSFGSTFWELASLKIPSFVLATSEREAYTYDLLLEDSIFLPLGRFSDTNVMNNIREALLNIETNQTGRVDNSKLEQLIDLNGVHRITKNINQLFL